MKIGTLRANPVARTSIIEALQCYVGVKLSINSVREILLESSLEMSHAACSNAVNKLMSMGCLNRISLHNKSELRFKMVDGAMDIYVKYQSVVDASILKKKKKVNPIERKPVKKSGCIVWGKKVDGFRVAMPNVGTVSMTGV